MESLHGMLEHVIGHNYQTQHAKRNPDGREPVAVRPEQNKTNERKHNAQVKMMNA